MARPSDAGPLTVTVGRIIDVAHMVALTAYAIVAPASKNVRYEEKRIVDMFWNLASRAITSLTRNVPSLRWHERRHAGHSCSAVLG